MSRNTIKFGKFEGATDHVEDDREAFIYCNGEHVGTIIAAKGNFGGVCAPEWRVARYEVELYDADGNLIKECSWDVRDNTGAPLMKPSEAKRLAKAWIAEVL